MGGSKLQTTQTRVNDESSGDERSASVVSEQDAPFEGDDDKESCTDESSNSEDDRPTFGEMIEQRAQMGKKAFQQLQNGGKQSSKKKPKTQRASKHAPMEMSSKRAVTRKRQVVDIASQKRRDPRFDHLSGKLNEDLFKKSYQFLENVKQQEKLALKKELASTKDSEKSAELTRTLQALHNKERAYKDKEEAQRIKREWRKQEAAAVKEGKSPFFMKRGEAKKLHLIAKTRGKTDQELNKMTEKKRKRDAGKDRKFLPRTRRTE